MSDAPALADLPWLRAAKRRLAAARAAGRMPHGILIQDPSNAGGDVLAAWTAALVLCEQPGEEGACGRCGSCRRLAAGSHADFQHITFLIDEKTHVPKTQIIIDQIRELSADLALTSHDGRGSVAIISPADAINPFAANALLKTLEEPRAGVVVILVVERAARLPATVVSRCQRIALRAPARAELLEFLQAARPSQHWPAALDALGNRPLVALASDPAQLAQLRDDMWPALAAAAAGKLDVVATAERWSRGDLAALTARLCCFENWLTSQVRAAFVPQAANGEIRPAAHLSYRPADTNIRALFKVIDGVGELKVLAATPINKSLGLERLLWQLRGGGDRQVHSE